MGRQLPYFVRRLGGRLKILRHERRLTQDELATASGVSQKYLSELERGVKAPSFETLVALAHRGFRIRLASLLFGVDEADDEELALVEQALAGRPAASRTKILKAVSLLLEASSIEAEHAKKA